MWEVSVFLKNPRAETPEQVGLRRELHVHVLNESHWQCKNDRRSVNLDLCVCLCVTAAAWWDKGGSVMAD